MLSTGLFVVGTAAVYIIYIYTKHVSFIIRSRLEEEVVCELIFEFHTCKIT